MADSAMKLFSRMPRVIIRLPSAVMTSRDIMRGILRYAQHNGPWSIQIIEGRENEQRTPDFDSQNRSGFIGYFSKTELPRFLRNVDVPVVLVDPVRLSDVPAIGRNAHVVGCVVCDNVGVGVAAADFFLSQRRFRHFAFVGEVTGSTWSEERFVSYRQTLAKHGFDSLRYPTPSVRLRSDTARERQRLCRWIRQLPRPCAVFVAFDMRARQVLDACLEARLSVPEEIALLSVDNDPTICETTTPQLSSIKMSQEQAGYNAAALLDKAMRQRIPRRNGPQVISYGFTDVVPRASTDVVLFGDPIVERAVACIRLNAGTPLTVKDIARHVSVSQRLLELHFKRVLGHTVHDEIMLTRLSRIKRILHETTDSIETIALNSGFANSSHLSTSFKRAFGITPSAFRRKQIS